MLLVKWKASLRGWGIGMYKSFKILFLVLLLLFLYPLVSSETCEPYEIYSITSVLPGDSWMVVVVHHSDWVCEMIAGEQTLRRDLPDGEYDLYYLFNGSNLLFLGRSNPLLGEPSITAEINGTLYILQHKEELVPYKNITLTINGEVRNLTITAKKTETKLYRFDECASLVWNCTRLELQNGTVISNCKGNPVLNYFFTGNPTRSLPGIRGKLQDGYIMFVNSTYRIPMAEFKKYFSSFPKDKIPKVFSTLHALPFDGGILIYYPGEIKVKMGSFLSELPFVFFYDGENLRRLYMSMDMQELPVCKSNSTLTLKKSQNQSTSLNTKNQAEINKREICGIGTLLFLTFMLLVWKRR